MRPVALVTGGATGIGAACCRELSRAGFAVGIHYNSSEAAARSLEAELPESFSFQADLATAGGADRVHDLLKERGGLEVLVNNAGITIDAPLFTARAEDVEKVVATNLMATWRLVKRLSRPMMRARSGRIVNISSVVGSTGNPGQGAYAMTKAAIDNLTRTAAYELGAYGILVTSVAPGFIRTRMTESLSEEARAAILARIPLGREGQPEEVARLVRFLATEGTYCTGSVFHVNGGMYGG